MKRCIFLILSLLLKISVGAQNIDELIVSTKIDEVKVYLNGAEIISEFELSLNEGRNKIIFKGLSPFIKEGSVQLSPGKKIELLSVTTKDSKIKEEITDPRGKVLKDSVEKLAYQIKLVQNEISAYSEEKETLKSNRYIGGSQSGISMEELSKATNFFRSRSLEINNALTQLEMRTERLKFRLDIHNLAYVEYLENFNSNRKEVIVELHATQAGKADFKLRYLVSNTGWTPSYDLISKNVNDPVTIKYKAQVYNNTAINWEEVKLALSTADPSLGASRPYLTT